MNAKIKKILGNINIYRKTYSYAMLRGSLFLTVLILVFKIWSGVSVTLGYAVGVYFMSYVITAVVLTGVFYKSEIDVERYYELDMSKYDVSKVLEAAYQNRKNYDSKMVDKNTYELVEYILNNSHYYKEYDENWETIYQQLSCPVKCTLEEIEQENKDNTEIFYNGLINKINDMRLKE